MLLAQKTRTQQAKAALLQMEERQAEINTLLKKKDLEEKMNLYYTTIKNHCDKSTVLGSAKESLDRTEYKLLLLML